MSEGRIAALEISAVLEAAYPAAFSDEYSLIECLGAGRGTETFLVRGKVSGKTCVAKCFDRSVYPAAAGSSIIKTLRHEGIPEFCGEYRDDRMVCIVRRYVEGTPLDRYMAYGAPSRDKMIDLCLGLLDILSYLHSLDHPVIHRDIKPQNIIVRPDGRLALIDFEIAREFSAADDTDTSCLGTRAYAPPEQYGFAQTDARTDLYAFGVVLRWMLTGETDERAAKVADKRLDAVIRRCTAFSPEDRFKSALQTKKALIRAGGHKKKTTAFLSAVLVLICLSAGFAAGRFTGIFAVPPGRAVRFREPLMEQAVRAQLGLGADGAITTEALATVRAVYIFGNEVSVSGEAFSDGLADKRKGSLRGTLASLEDVRMLPNLETLYVNYQVLSDISPLSRLQHLTEVNLRHTCVADISALSGMAVLADITLYDTFVTDISCLDTCPRVAFIEAGKTRILSLAALGGRLSAKYLGLEDLALISLAGIERFYNLETLCLSGTGLSDLTPLASLEKLKRVVLDGSMRAAARKLDGVPFEIVNE